MRCSLIKRPLQASVLVIALFISAQAMEARKFGVGFMAGAPTGISFKYWLNGINALTGGFSLGSDAGLQLNYLWHDFAAIRVTDGRLPVHYGFGAQVQNERYHGSIGLRGVLGLTYMFERSPFDAYVELAPLLWMGDNPGFWLTASFGARYFFQ